MTDEKKLSPAQKFCQAVDAAKTPEDLFALTYEILQSSHSHRSLEQRIGNTEIPETNVARHIRAEIARTKVALGHDLRTAEKLTILIDTFYEKGFDKMMKRNKQHNATHANNNDNARFANLLDNYSQQSVVNCT